jgi:hypothetical protein|tara:strand:+ start:2724 stop:3044 length:321 start_codon:yes stop_codon:yes gene_type:complete
MLYKKSKKQRVTDFAKSNPSMSRKEMAKAVNVKLKYLYSILSEAGLTDKNHAAAKSPAGVKKSAKRKQVVKKPTLLVTFSITGNTFVWSLDEAREVYNELKPLMEG